MKIFRVTYPSIESVPFLTNPSKPDAISNVHYGSYFLLCVVCRHLSLNLASCLLVIRPWIRVICRSEKRKVVVTSIKAFPKVPDETGASCDGRLT